MRKLTKFIAFGHEKEVGKSTAAKLLGTHLRATYPWAKIQRCGIADKFKKHCFEIFSWTGLRDLEYYEDNTQAKKDFLPELGLTVRDLWVKYSQSLKASFDQDLWINSLIKNCSADFCLIYDLRFIEEVQALIPLETLFVKVSNSRVEHSSDVADDSLLDWKGWHAELYNNWTVKDLEKQVINLANQYLKI